MKDTVFRIKPRLLRSPYFFFFFLQITFHYSISSEPFKNPAPLHQIFFNSNTYMTHQIRLLMNLGEGKLYTPQGVYGPIFSRDFMVIYSTACLSSYISQGAYGPVHHRETSAPSSTCRLRLYTPQGVYVFILLWQCTTYGKCGLYSIGSLWLYTPQRIYDHIHSRVFMVICITGSLSLYSTGSLQLQTHRESMTIYLPIIPWPYVPQGVYAPIVQWKSMTQYTTGSLLPFTLHGGYGSKLHRESMTLYSTWRLRL